MSSRIKQYQVMLTTVGPVFVGSGKELTKKEYLFLPAGQVGVVDIPKLYAVMGKRRLVDKFENYYVNDTRTDLKRWLEDNRVSPEEYRNCLKYSLYAGDTVLQRGTKTQIMEFMKDPYGLPYIPGSTLKGLFRTILLAADIMKAPDKYKSDGSKIQNAKEERNRQRYLSSEARGLEQHCFNTLGREDTRTGDAVNDILSGLIISDSEPISIKDLVLCQKVERYVDGEETRLNLLRECIKPGVKIKFTLTIDETLFAYSVQDLLNAVEAFNDCYNDCFVTRFCGVDRSAGKMVYVGGGCGFVSKTVVYPLYGQKDGIAAAQQIFQRTGVPKEHQHYKDAREYHVSPHILKCTKYNRETLQMGLCKIIIA